MVDFIFNFVFLVEHVYLLLPLYINQSIKKNFPIQTFFKMIVSSIKNPGEVEYDKQNWLQHQKISVLRTIRSEINLLLALYINQSITKKFPTEKLLEMIDSSVRSPGEVESVTSRSVLIRNFFVMDRFLYSNKRT